MVSADNLNLDVLELIFLHLSGNDLPAVALVSRSFFAGVIPRLYRTIPFRIHQAKRYANLMSPFATIVANPSLALHVRHVEIRTIPRIKSTSQLHPVFLRDCTEALKLCSNLLSFKCTVNAIAPFLSSLQGKERLDDIRVHADITTDQAKLLVRISNLRSLALDCGSWNVIDVLPKWSQSIKNTLTNLILWMSNELNETVLESVLVQLPGLLGLHVVGCSKVDHVAVLRLVSHTPLLEDLSFTTTENSRDLINPPPSLCHLRTLAFDTRYSMVPSPAPTIVASILAHIKPSSPPLISFIMRLPDRKVMVGHPFIEQLLLAHAHTLREVSFIDASVAMESVLLICKSCIHLERLAVPIPLKEIGVFTHSIAKSYSLRTLVDTDTHAAHGPHPSLSPENARFMMKNVRNLRKIVTDKRIWLGKRGADNVLKVSLERCPAQVANSYWFLRQNHE